MDQHLIIVAGGIGTRMKSDRPKQFIELKGKAIIIRTLDAFLSYNPLLKTVICVHRNYRQHLEGLLEKAGLNGFDIRITYGGETRYESVKNGLKLMEQASGVVGIHDAARPLVSQQTIKTCYETAAQKGSAVPCVSVTESLRKISNNINSSVNRNEFKMIQTPQCFQISKVRSAFEQPYSAAFTDDATVFEASGQSVVLVEGNEENFKITSPMDLLMAQCLIT